MSIIQKHLPFVNEQMAVQTKLATKYRAQDWRNKLHSDSFERFRQMATDLAELDRQLDEQEKAPARPSVRVDRLSLRHEDVVDLPKELLAELSYTGFDKLEEAIVQAIKNNGGAASLDQLLVAIFRQTGEVYKRTTLTSRLYRMAQKSYVFPVPDKKGVYALSQLTEAEAAALFGADKPDLIDEIADHATAESK